jgi:hypothetical protein
MPTAISTEPDATVDQAPADTMPAKAPVIVLAGRSKPARSRAHRCLRQLTRAFRGYGCALAGRLLHAARPRQSDRRAVVCSMTSTETFSATNVTENQAGPRKQGRRTARAAAGMESVNTVSADASALSAATRKRRSCAKLVARGQTTIARGSARLPELPVARTFRRSESLPASRRSKSLAPERMCERRQPVSWIGLPGS